ncbi:MAG: sulfatase [Actinomycetota bacterium]|nr:sulfatase [Actinomycetota bacterium]
MILIVTDDQALDEMQALPSTSTLIGGAGVTFKRAYISYPLCCPSRASLFSGQYMHNHNVRGNELPKGGWQRFRDLGTEAKALPTWLQDAGYYNVEIGKYMNGYGGATPPIPPGWDEWYGKLSEYDENVVGGSIYFNYRLREDPPASGGVPCPGGPPPSPGAPFTCSYGQDPGDYQTDVVGAKAVDAIERLSGPGSPPQPFFLSVDFNAPHSPYVPAPRHDGAYAKTSLPKPSGQNEKDVSDKPRFLRRLPKLGKGKLGQIADRRRARLEMLLSVDEQVAAIVQALSDEGQLDNTYLVFLSDNGYFAGEHRIRQGKYLPYEPSSHVPMMIRGPGIPAGQSSNTLVSNVDVAATIADIADATPALTQDGRSLLPLAASPGSGAGRPILLEGDTGAGIDDDGAETPAPPLDAADQKRLKNFYKKRKAQKRKLRQRCKTLKRESPKRAQLCYRKGVSNLEQEPTDTTYKLQAPAYSALRTERYLLTLYATGELELYDMAKDPFQLNSVHESGSYKAVRKWMLARLADYRKCSGADCLAGVGTEPKPLKKKTKKKARP